MQKRHLVGFLPKHEHNGLRKVYNTSPVANTHDKVFIGIITLGCVETFPQFPHVRLPVDQHPQNIRTIEDLPDVVANDELFQVERFSVAHELLQESKNHEIIQSKDGCCW